MESERPPVIEHTGDTYYRFDEQKPWAVKCTVLCLESLIFMVLLHVLYNLIITPTLIGPMI